MRAGLAQAYPPVPVGGGGGTPRILQIISLALVIVILTVVISIVLGFFAPLNFGDYIGRAGSLIAIVIGAMSILLIVYIVFIYIPTVIQGRTG